MQIGSNIPKCGVIRQALNIDLENNFNQLYLKSLGFDGKVPDRDYFLGFNYLFKEAFNESGYKYTEVSSKIPVLFGNFLERILHEVGKQLQVVFPANFFNNFKYFFHILIAGIYGEKHDAHSQMIYYGIQALTIKGKQNPKVTSDFQTTLNNLFNVVDGGIRANFSLDEQLHAGSTLYYPVTKSTQITIKKLPIGLILIALPIAIQYLSVYFKSQGDQSINTFKVYGRHIITVFHSLFILVIPSFAEKLFPYAFPNQGNPVFCQDWSSINNPQLINLFLLFVCLTVGSRLLIKIGIAKVSLKETRKDGDYSSTVNGLMIGLSAVLYLFINTSVSYIFLVVLSPFFYIQRPLIPRSARDFLRTAATIGALYLTYFILVQVQVNYYEETIEAVITYQCIPSHKLLFAVAILFNLTWNQVELFLI